MKNILIGAPIYKREWILPKWIECIENQNYPKENLGFIFELGSNDDATHEILWDWQTKSQFKVFDGEILMKMNHETHPEGHRTWNAEKYYNMVTLRNTLLERATALSDSFDVYFSLDSDILLENPDTLSILVNEMDKGLDVLSPLSYMSPRDTNYPSAMTWDNEFAIRCARRHDLYRIGETFECDVVMAAVMMSKPVFTQARYRWNPQGEDIGFAKHLRELGFKSYAAWSVYCPHIMHRAMLEEYIKMGFDPRKPF